MNEQLKTYLHKVSFETEQMLEQLLPSAKTYPQSIHKIMRYSMFAGGKRVRPALIMAAYNACRGRPGNKKVLLACAAVEMLHTFSLMHDDLPCMDDDDFRRGKPSAHKAFCESLAVLGGDALCIFAFECLVKTGHIEVIAEIAGALGTDGMIGGQVVDIESEGKKVSAKTVEYIHKRKTAALIKSCVRIGAIMAKASPVPLEKLTSYGERIGLAFQIVDDILDEEGTTEQIGKDAGSDREKGKATYPAIFGMAKSKRMATSLIEESCADIKFLGKKGEILRLLAEFIRNRIS